MHCPWSSAVAVISTVPSFLTVRITVPSSLTPTVAIFLSLVCQLNLIFFAGFPLIVAIASNSTEYLFFASLTSLWSMPIKSSLSLYSKFCPPALIGFTLTLFTQSVRGTSILKSCENRSIFELVPPSIASVSVKSTIPPFVFSAAAMVILPHSSFSTDARLLSEVLTQFCVSLLRNFGVLMSAPLYR